MGSAIARAMAERPSVTQDDIQSAVSQAMEAQQGMMPERMSTTITVALANVGAPSSETRRASGRTFRVMGFSDSKNIFLAGRHLRISRALL